MPHQKSYLLKVEGLDKNSFLEMNLSSLSAGSFKCLGPECCILLAGNLNSDFDIYILFYLGVREINLLFNLQKRAPVTCFRCPSDKPGDASKQ